MVDRLFQPALPEDRVTLRTSSATTMSTSVIRCVAASGSSVKTWSGECWHTGFWAPEQPGPLYADADVFALASYEQAYGTVFGEALAAGPPVVGWHSGTFPK